jgi:hypothetical protein
MNLCYTLSVMRRWISNFFVGVIAAVAVASPAAYAVGTPVPSGASTANGSAGQGLEISPPVIELAADPGQTVTTDIRVRNVTKNELIAKGKADDFGAGSGEDGQPKLLLDETGSTRFSLKYWVSGVPDLRLASQEIKTSHISIKVPANAEPGGHFGVVRFTAVPPDLEGTGVALSASVGTLILLKVSGTITENLSLAEFSALKGDQKTNFFEYGPVNFLVRLRNDGSVHEKAKGNIEVISWTGKKIATIPVNEKGGNVLPDSVRRFEQSLDKKQLFGHYTAALNLTYSSGKSLKSDLGFWVIPWKLLLLVLVGLIVLVFLLRLGIKRYNAYIISKAGGRR